MPIQQIIVFEEGNEERTLLVHGANMQSCNFAHI